MLQSMESQRVRHDLATEQQGIVSVQVSPEKDNQQHRYTHTHTSSCMLAAVVQSLSHVQLCDPMDCSTPGFPVLHHHPDFTQVHVV